MRCSMTILTMEPELEYKFCTRSNIHQTSVQYHRVDIQYDDSMISNYTKVSESIFLKENHHQFFSLVWSPNGAPIEL